MISSVQILSRCESAQLPFFVTGFWRSACESDLRPGLALLVKIHQHISLRCRGITSKFFVAVEPRYNTILQLSAP